MTDTPDPTPDETPDAETNPDGDVVEATPDAPPAQSYRVIRGLGYPDADGHEKRAEPGDLVDDIPEGSVGWLLNDGAIEKA